MLRAFSTAATGMSAQQMQVDVIANNLANINTNGFKRSQLDFEDLMYVAIKAAGAETAGGLQNPTGLDIGSGVSAGSTVKVFTNGEMQNTGRQLDVAIQGDGFLKVTGGSGEVYYTRDGSLRLDRNGDMVTATGMMLDGGTNIPAGATAISIGKNGAVSYRDDAGVLTPGNIIQIYRFNNPSGLASQGGNLYTETDASGSAAGDNASVSGNGELKQGYLEKSNVQMVTELVNLITAQRAYEINSRAIKAGDEMLTTANRLIGG